MMTALPSNLDVQRNAELQYQNNGNSVPMGSMDTHFIAKSIEDFKLIKPISRGAYGKVYLGYRKDKPGTLYAIKAIKKEDLVRKNMVNSVHIERKAFCLSAAEPFCVRLFYSFQTPRTVFLVMEYMIGGDLKSLLAMMGFFTPKAAAFYTAEISLALEFIHKCGVVHRDVKPDNILIDARGHIKLTDFGLSRVNMESDLTPRRMINFTPGQLMSLKTEFRFPSSSENSSTTNGQAVSLSGEIEKIRGNENSFIISCDISTPVCSQEASSMFIQSRRFRKPLRKLRNVGNKATVSVERQNAKETNIKLTPEYPKYDLNDWSIIQTPKENKPKFMDYGSFVNVSFEESPVPATPEIPHQDSILHHSSPIEASQPASKIPKPILSPLFPPETPYSSDVYFHETMENAPKKLKSEHINVESVQIKVSYPLPIGTCSINTVSSGNSASTGSFGASFHHSPEKARRDNTHLTYMNVMQNMSNPAAAHNDLSIAKLTNFKSNNCSHDAIRHSYKRKRWTTSMSKTGISTNLQNLDLGSFGSNVSSGKGSAERNSGSVNQELKRNQSPPEVSGDKIVGTPDYLAPEIIAKRPHGSPVDWWSLGVCLYEFTVGCLPFNGQSLNTIFRNIENRILEYPDDMDPSVQYCIDALTCLNPEKRPDLQRLRSSEFKGFFGDLPWDNMSSAEPPFVPSPSSPTDTGYFMPRNKERNIQVSEVFTP